MRELERGREGVSKGLSEGRREVGSDRENTGREHVMDDIP